jgi:hypothetical protein
MIESMKLREVMKIGRLVIVSMLLDREWLT